MSTVTLVSIDIGKHNFHLHAQDKTGKEVLRKNPESTFFQPDSILIQRFRRRRDETVG